MFDLGHHNSYSPQRTKLPKVRFSIAWLLLLTALVASLSVHVANYLSMPTSSESRFPPIDGMFEQGRFVDLACNDRLFLRFRAMEDSGVEIERVKNGRTVWIAYMDPLYVAHSAYSHDAFVRIDNWKTTRKIEIISIGSCGRITEIRNVDTGDLISRDDSELDDH